MGAGVNVATVLEVAALWSSGFFTFCGAVRIAAKRGSFTLFVVCVYATFAYLLGGIALL